MHTTRQDAWTKDEDMLLAETVLRYIREGRTQLEAFKQVAKELSRTSAACGFRWNANIRKQYEHAIKMAKETRKTKVLNHDWHSEEPQTVDQRDPIDKAILLLEKMKFSHIQREGDLEKEMIKKLKEENLKLRESLTRYEDAWMEMGKLWEWIKKDTSK